MQTGVGFVWICFVELTRKSSLHENGVDDTVIGPDTFCDYDFDWST